MATLVWKEKEYTLAKRTPKMAKFLDGIEESDSYSVSKLEYNYASEALGAQLSDAIGTTDFEEVDTIELDILCAEIESAYKEDIEKYRYEKNMQSLERNKEQAEKLIEEAEKATKKNKKK